MRKAPSRYVPCCLCPAALKTHAPARNTPVNRGVNTQSTQQKWALLLSRHTHQAAQVGIVALGQGGQGQQGQPLYDVLRRST